MRAGASQAGEAWNCPHCGERILRSAAVCPACQRHLRVDATRPRPQAGEAACPLSVEGLIQHPGSSEPWEYAVLVEVHDGRGELLARRVVGVGAMRSAEARSFSLRVEVFAPGPVPPFRP
ncbi:MAG: hypothetical protein HYY19_01435 [Candidatus Rokubacteria bacterium]|nr:hypothetical protein [Candidatus Rokubacteria bacterium]